MVCSPSLKQFVVSEEQEQKLIANLYITEERNPLKFRVLQKHHVDISAPSCTRHRAFIQFPIFGKVLLTSSFFDNFQVYQKMPLIRSCCCPSWCDGIRRTLFLAAEAIFCHPQSISRRLAGCSRRDCCKFSRDELLTWLVLPRHNVVTFCCCCS